MYKNKIFKDNSGFTLIELLLVVGLLALSVGVAGDIIVTLIRSYNKTQITNEIEQNGNFVMNKLENELRSSQTVTDPTTLNLGQTSLTFERDVAGTTATITYELQNGKLYRTYDDGTSSTTAILTNDDSVKGVTVTCPANSCFTLIKRDPDVVLVNFNLQNVGSTGVAKPFTGSMDISSTIVLRGSY